MILNYTQQKELASFDKTIELINQLCDVIKHIFRIFRHVTQYLAHWVNRSTAEIDIFLHARSGPARMKSKRSWPPRKQTC